MNATARHPDDLVRSSQEQDDREPQPMEPSQQQGVAGPPLSVWFWIVPLILLFSFLGFFWHRHRHDPPPASISGVNTLPEVGVVQFDRGSPTLTPDGEATLDRAAQAMLGNPNVHLRLEGYDGPPAKLKKQDRSRDPLTLQRALAVQRYLGSKGIERLRITGGSPLHAVTSRASIFPDPEVESRRAELYVQ